MFKVNSVHYKLNETFAKNLKAYHALLGYLSAGGLCKTILTVSDFLFVSPRAFPLAVLVQEPKKFDTKFVGLPFNKGPALK